MANTITVLRLPVLVVVVALLYARSAPWRVAATPLIVILILMDTMDGIVARARDESTLLGSVLDIMVDRTVELVLWICLSDMGLVSVVIPIIFVVRGTIVDGLRSVHVSEGQRPFDSVRSPLGRALVKSPWMRTSYGIVKCVAFAGLALASALALYAAQGSLSQAVADGVRRAFQGVAWLATAFCLARGIPVIVEAASTLTITDSQEGGRA
ncbi:MAG: CDP-alcohol phosphatidyltransferase family protein [Anaerolineae bacterium]|nr:CDP-alcohol phosphatidyltransferase family protein [Anaerolineae bacterium]